MSRLIESIKLLDGKFYNLPWHEQRMNHALRSVCNVKERFQLQRFLEELQRPGKGLFKCRIVYDEQAMQPSFIPYTPKPIRTLQVVEHDTINYEHKFSDRSAIDKLFADRKNCDDILIVRNGMITDSSFCNIVFKTGDRWVTPSAPLLKGTMRQSLLDSGDISAEPIRKADVPSFRSFRLINAMIGFDGPEIDVSNIVF